MKILILILILIIEINLSKAQTGTYHGIEIQFYLNIIFIEIKIKFLKKDASKIVS